MKGNVIDLVHDYLYHRLSAVVVVIGLIEWDRRDLREPLYHVPLGSRTSVSASNIMTTRAGEDSEPN